MKWLICGTLFALFSIGYCDYKCVCNYNVEKSVMLTPSTQGNVLGYMYEFDCKPQEGQSGDEQWISVAFEHKLGYVEKDSNLQIQTCPGAIPDEDKLPLTTKTVETTVLQTTLAITSTTPTIMSSAKPTDVTASPALNSAETTQRSTTLPSTVYTQSTTLPTTVNTQSTTLPTTVTTQSSALPTTVTTQSTTLPSTITTQSTTLPTTSTTQSTNVPTTVTTQSTTVPTTFTTQSTTLPTTVTTKSSTLPTTVTTQSTTTARVTTLQGHLELCPSRIQHLAKQPGELIAQFGQKCYEVVQASVSWSHAESNCKRNGGHLVQIANQQEQDFVYNFLQKYHSRTVWLGLHDRNQEEKFEWTSGDPVTYTHWKVGRKDYRYHNSEDCVYMTPTNGLWDDIQCGGDNALSELFQGHHHSYVCQYATVHPSQSDGNINMCPYSLHQQAERDRGVLGQYGHSCYELIQNARVDWQRAESVCHSRGGHLAEISNAQEQTFLLGFLNRYSKNHAVWIGLTDLNSEGHFHWSSGSPVQFTNWVPDHISNFVSHTQEDCTVFIPYKNGQWDDLPCGRTIHSLFGGTSSSGETHPLLCQYGISAQPAIVG